MADFNDEVEAFRETLRRTREITEDDILVREGYYRNAAGIYGEIETASKKRARLEQQLNKELEDAFGKNAVLNRKQQNKFEEQIANMNYIIDSNGKYVKSTIELTNEQKKILSNLKDANEKAEKIAKAAENPGKEFGALASKFKDSKAIVGEFSEKILESTKHSAVLTATYQLAEAGLGGLYKATVSMTKSLYAGERGATVSAKAFSELTESIGSMVQGVGAAVAVFSIFTPFGKLLRLAGAGLALLGAGIKTYGEYQKLGAEQNKKLFDTYNKLSASGLQASKGLTGVFETVQTLGMTAAEIEKFTELLVNNSKELKLFGATAADGAKKYTEVAGALVKSDIGEKLEKMGIAAEDQREHTLRYMANQTRMGMAQGKTQQELIRGSQTYIEELDKISMITGATRKEQEEARAAVMAEENLRAAMLQAEVDGDKERQKQLKAISDYATYLRATGDTRGATGVVNYGAMGGPVDDASAAAMITYGKGIEAALNGKPIAEVIKEGQKSADQTLKQMASTRAVGGDVSGLVTGKYGNLLDTSKMNAELLKAVGPNGDINAYLTKLQEQRAKADDKLNATVEGNRKQQDAAMMMDSVVFSKFNHAAEIHRKSSEIFNSAVKTFSETVGAKPVAGGGYSTGGGGGAAPAAPSAAAPMSSTGGGAATGNPNLTRQSLRSRGLGAPPTPGPGVNVASTSRGLPSTQSADDVMKLIRFQGDELGTRAHFDRLEPDVKQKFMDMIAEYGKPVQINAAMRSYEEQKKLYVKWIKNGKVGNPVAEPGKSNHNYGRALDLNRDQVATLASSGLLAKYGFNTIPNDPPHIEMARFGGVFSGPESGYPVMLHGDKETVVTKPQFDEMANGVKKESVSTAMKNLDSTTSNPVETPAVILQELMGMMEDKFNEMISQLSTGNDISDKLLRNSMV